MKHKKISLGFTLEPLLKELFVPAMAVTIGGQVTHSNSLAQDLLALDPEDVAKGVNIARFLTANSSKKFHAFVQDAVDNPLCNNLQLSLHNQGRIVPFTVAPLRDDNGALIGLLCQQKPQMTSQLLVSWHEALENCEHGLWEIDIEADRATYSDQWFRLRGRVRGDPLTHRPDQIFERVHEDDCDSVRFNLAACLAQDSDTFSFEYRERHADGHYLWILSRGRVVARDSAGAPIRFVGTDTDITRPKSSQNLIDDLTHRETRWKVAIESADQAVWDNDRLGNNFFVSETWRTMRGYARDEDVNDICLNWQSYIHPEDIDTIRAEIARSDSGETDYVNYQYRWRHKDGHWLWIMSRGRVVTRTSDGAPIRVVGTDTDISEIKRAEEEQAYMSERLNVAMRAADMGSWEYNLRDDTAYWDESLREMFGLEGDKSLVSSDLWATFIHPEDRERALRSSEDAMKQGVDQALDYRIRRPDGEIVHMRCRAKYLSDPKAGDRFVGVNINITDDVLRQKELEATRTQLEYESRHDALTGLANRRLLDERQISISNVEGSKGTAVLHIDLDHFKQINDTLGHAAGDAVLKRAAEILRQKTQGDWLAARVGGDEFVILIPACPNDDDLQQLAEDIIQSMAEPFSFEGQPCNFGVSIGIAKIDRGRDVDGTLFEDADLALYSAKKTGIGKWKFFDPTMRTTATDRKAAVDALLAGIENNEITCFYQPQFEAKTLRLSGLEALVRWQRKDGEVLLPDKFMSTAQELGIIAKIDEIVLERACSDLKNWEALGHDVPGISVNVSASRLSDPGLVDSLKKLKVPPQRFSFELLESAFLDSVDQILTENLAALADLGIDIEVDDFGSGHASIVSLLKIAPDRLKIDRQLVAPITHSNRQRNLIRTIISIGHMQSASVVAEGVESVEHVKILKQLGCDYLQGYGLGRPLPYDGVTDLLQTLRSSHGRLNLAPM